MIAAIRAIKLAGLEAVVDRIKPLVPMSSLRSSEGLESGIRDQT
jgi:hypothetical protein